MRIERCAAMRMVQSEARRLPARFAGCVMCGLIARTPPEQVLARSRGSLAVLARFGVRRGHLLVVPRRHTDRWQDVRWSEWQTAQRLAWEAARALEAALGATRVFVASLGSAVARPMTFPHHHLHVVPLHRGDRRDRPAQVFTWQNGVVLYDDDEARRLSDEIRAAWPRARGRRRHSV